MRLGRGGSLLKDLRLLQKRQKLKANTMLLAADDTQLNSTPWRGGVTISHM